MISYSIATLVVVPMSALALSGHSEAANERFRADMGRPRCNVRLSNRPGWVKRFQPLVGVDVAHGLVPRGTSFHRAVVEFECSPI